jgi:hypothetical protein
MTSPLVDQALQNKYGLTPEQLKKARDWWNGLPDVMKSHASIWVLFALYGKLVKEEE